MDTWCAAAAIRQVKRAIGRLEMRRKEPGQGMKTLTNSGVETLKTTTPLNSNPLMHGISCLESHAVSLAYKHDLENGHGCEGYSG